MKIEKHEHKQTRFEPFSIEIFFEDIFDLNIFENAFMNGYHNTQQPVKSIVLDVLVDMIRESRPKEAIDEVGRADGRDR